MFARLKRSITIVFLLLLAVPVVVAFVSALRSQQAPLLVSTGRGRWIEPRRKLILGTLPHNESWIFKREFDVASSARDISLSLRAFKQAVVYFDNVIVAHNDSGNWRSPLKINLSGPFLPGPHEIKVSVSNEMGPVLLEINSNCSALDTDAHWVVSKDGDGWFMTEIIGAMDRPDIAEKLPSTIQGLRHSLPVFAGVCMLMGLAWAILRRWSTVLRCRNLAGWLRWALLAGLAVLAINNAPKLPLGVGYDVHAHLDYILYVADNCRIPLAVDGWQMFQSPLYYVVSAIWWNVSSMLTVDPSLLLTALRFIPLVCGLLQVELAYRAVRHVFPGNASAQIAGTLVGGLLPMNIYISQVFGNEPMSGVLSAGCLVYMLGLLNEPSLLIRQCACLGALLGLALLAKATAILLFPVVLFALIQTWMDKGTPVRTVLASTGILSLTALGVAGWYYIRNWIILGSPFIGGWSRFNVIPWWQDPGYRTLGDLLSFGGSLKSPFCAATEGFWDSIYSTLWTDGSLSGVTNTQGLPPWDYDLLAACGLVSLVLTLIIAIGIGAALRRHSPRGMGISAYAVACYISAIFSLYIVLPIYSTGKATYLNGITPCFAVLFASGFSVLYKHRLFQFPIAVLLGCWAVASYCGFFIK